jgi:hypothetical protein
MPGVALRQKIEPKPFGARAMKQSQAAIFTAFLLLTSAPAYAMCGGGGNMEMGASKGKAAGGMQCGGSMSGMKMDGMDMGEKKGPDSKAEDPHAGMDMGAGKGDAKKAGGCCCGCCGSGGDGKSGGQSGGMCGKQAAATVDGKNDPLLNDPMWDKSRKAPQSHAPAAP